MRTSIRACVCTCAQELGRLLGAAMTNVFLMSELVDAPEEMPAPRPSCGAAGAPPPRGSQRLLTLKLGEALFARASLLNHSCAPNTSLRWAGRTLELRAARDLRNEQLFGCYGPQVGHAARDERRAALRRSHYFECCCVACAVESSQPRGQTAGGAAEARELAERLDARALAACDAGDYAAAAELTARALRALRSVFRPGDVQLAHEEAKLGRLLFNADAGPRAAQALVQAAASLRDHGETEESADLYRLAAMCRGRDGAGRA